MNKVDVENFSRLVRCKIFFELLWRLTRCLEYFWTTFRDWQCITCNIFGVSFEVDKVHNIFETSLEADEKHSEYYIFGLFFKSDKVQNVIFLKCLSKLIKCKTFLQHLWRYYQEFSNVFKKKHILRGFFFITQIPFRQSKPWKDIIPAFLRRYYRVQTRKKEVVNSKQHRLSQYLQVSTISSNLKDQSPIALAFQ